MSIYHTLGNALLTAGIALAIITIFDYAIFLANNSGTLYVNPYEYIQYSVIALLVISGIVLIIKFNERNGLEINNNKYII